ncbi:hypothetical protein HOY80DRAFT_587656 [Tuber brumale]|nr:hypothetical protein HOY80DRAFT_587656 [Tuber brumale]
MPLRYPSYSVEHRTVIINCLFCFKPVFSVSLFFFFEVSRVPPTQCALVCSAGNNLASPQQYPSLLTSSFLSHSTMIYMHHPHPGQIKSSLFSFLPMSIETPRVISEHSSFQLDSERLTCGQFSAREQPERASNSKSSNKRGLQRGVSRLPKRIKISRIRQTNKQHTGIGNMMVCPRTSKGARLYHRHYELLVDFGISWS